MEGSNREIDWPWIGAASLFLERRVTYELMAEFCLTAEAFLLLGGLDRAVTVAPLPQLTRPGAGRPAQGARNETRAGSVTPGG